MRTFLVLVDDSVEMPVALHYAAHRAAAVKGRVALLSIVEPEEISAWGGVDLAMTDEAFAKARKEVATHEKTVEALGGGKPVALYRKGEKRKVLLDVIRTEDVSVLVLAAQTKEGGQNPMIQYLTSDKGLRKLNIPLIIVPDTCREETAEGNA